MGALGQLQFGSVYTVTRESMDNLFPYALKELGQDLLRHARPDWETVKITIEPGVVGGATWRIRVECLGGGRNCIARGAK